MSDVKPVSRSRTVWAGAGVTVLGAVPMLLDVWLLVDGEYRDVLEGLFGPQLVMAIGVAMIVLRVLTTQPIVEPGE